MWIGYMYVIVGFMVDYKAAAMGQVYFDFEGEIFYGIPRVVYARGLDESVSVLPIKQL